MEALKIKQEMLRLAQQLPDDATWDDVMHEIYVRQAIENGLADSRAGRVVTHDAGYAQIAQSKLEQETSFSRIGEAWVSVFLNTVSTLRDKDWESLKQHFFIPTPIETIDHTAIKLASAKQFCVCSDYDKHDKNLLTLPYMN